MKGNILFIIHDIYQEDNYFPLGIGYLSAMLIKYGHNVTICCQDVFHYSNQELIEKYLINNEYDLIGVGFSAARFKETVLDLCCIVNKYKKKAKFVLGAHGPSPIPGYIIEKTKADIVIKGEAEETLIEVLNCTIGNSTVKIDYLINDTRFLSKVFSGLITVQTDAPQDQLESRRIPIDITVYNLGYDVGGMPIVFVLIGGFLLFVSLSTIIYVKLPKKKKLKIQKSLQLT